MDGKDACISLIMRGQSLLSTWMQSIDVSSSPETNCLQRITAFLPISSADATVSQAHSKGIGKEEERKRKERDKKEERKKSSVSSVPPGRRKEEEEERKGRESLPAVTG